MMLRSLVLIGLLATGGSVAAAEGKIIKVLQHLLDEKGRNALAPSLYERDSYQAFLRLHPEKISALRFDVQYKAKGGGPLALRMEIRGSKMPVGKSRLFETDIEPTRTFARWGELNLDKVLYSEVGNIVAWRASLWQEGVEVASQESFLW
jgi:hypothetical protein